MGTDSAAVEVVRSLSVPLSQAQTFKLFTTRVTDFWPKEYSIGSAEIAEVVIEPRSGGRWFERGIDGSECLGGRAASWIRHAKSCCCGRSAPTGSTIPTSEPKSRCRSLLKGPGALDWIRGTAICSAMETTPSRCG
jgi:hypothetical protein